MRWLPWAYPTLCWKKKRIRLSLKITILPSGTLSQTLNLADFFSSARQSSLPLAVYYTERPPLFTTPWALRNAARRAGSRATAKTYNN